MSFLPLQLVTAVGLLAGTPPPMPEADALDTIAALEDLRAGTERLQSFSRPPHGANVRARAFLALGRNEADADKLGATFAAGLEDRDSEVRRMVAFAIGELDDPRHEALLTAHVRLEPERRVVREIWKALGRIGGKATLQRASTAPPHYLPWAIVGAGLAARRLGKKPWEVPVIKAALESRVAAELAAGLYAVSRGTFKQGPADVYRTALASLEHDDPDVRLQASRALMGKRFKGATLADIKRALLGDRLTSHQKAWMLRGWSGAGTAEAWKSVVMAMLAKAGPEDPLTPGHHALAATLKARGQVDNGPVRKAVAAWLGQGKKAPAADTRRMRRLQCLDGFGRECLATPEGVQLGTDAGDFKAVIGVLGDAKAKAAVKMAALMALAPKWKARDKVLSRRQVPLLKGALAGPDGPVAAVAADIAAKQGLAELLPSVVAAQKRFGANVEVAADLVKAVHALGDAAAKKAVLAWAAASKEPSLRRLAERLGKPAAKGAPKPVARAKPAPNTLNLKPYRQARTTDVVGAWLHTEAGKVALRFHTHLAPLTVANFVKLARKGYYNGIKFHRVVPGFVVQAGDPRGDGWGGPGYTIRCENNPTPYTTGVLGMALAGKDTGGSQWFITLTPQPHLLGTYTVFGEVATGMDVVRRLGQDDRILKVEIVTHKGRRPWTP